MVRINNRMMLTFKIKELKFAIKKRKNKKSPGYDGIPIEIIKLAPEKYFK